MSEDIFLEIFHRPLMRKGFFSLICHEYANTHFVWFLYRRLMKIDFDKENQKKKKIFSRDFFAPMTRTQTVAYEWFLLTLVPELPVSELQIDDVPDATVISLCCRSSLDDRTPSVASKNPFTL